MTKKVLQALTVCLLSFCLIGSVFAAAHSIPANVGPDLALKTLLDGNKRFVAGKMLHPSRTEERRILTAREGQKPFVVLLSCSDSRVPPEIIFDAGIGDIFSVRAAGNVADKIGLGSMEYAVDHFGTTLIMVLGHSRCGAVSAAVSKAQVGGNITSIIDKIRPAVGKAEGLGLTGDALVEETVVDNVKQSIEDILSSSHEIKDRVKAGKVRIIGAVYDLEHGTVTRL
jgi:carbonic anhydrase